MISPGISLVIPAHNEAFYLPQILEGIDRARDEVSLRFGIPTEIIVVDNNSTDETAAVAAELGVRVVPHPVRNIASVRNAGLAAARYSVLVTLDSDTLVPRDAFVRVWETLLDPQIIGGGTRVGVVNPRGHLQSIVFMIVVFMEVVEGISGGMFFFRRSTFDAIGGFPEEYLVSEDVAFARKLKRYGRKHGLRFCTLKSVKLLLLDRKDVTRVAALRALYLAIKSAFWSRKIGQDELAYWYDPKR